MYFLKHKNLKTNNLKIMCYGSYDLLSYYKLARQATFCLNTNKQEKFCDGILVVDKFCSLPGKRVHKDSLESFHCSSSTIWTAGELCTLSLEPKKIKYI